MTDGGIEAALLRQRAGVGHHAKGVHLQAVIVMEAQGLVGDDAGIEFKLSLRLHDF